MAYDTSYADQRAQQQIGEAQKTQQSALKQAYINRLQNQQKLNQNLAMSGIRGGMTETANLNLANQYGQARAAANADYSNSVLGINNATEENKFNNMMQTESARRQYVENREAEDRANAREDQMIAYERRTANLTAQYSKYYSVDKLQERLKKTTDPLERQIINSRIGYLRSVAKGH